MLRFIAFLLTFAVVACSTLAGEDRDQDELSRRQLGTVHFPISCEPNVQKTFESGVALLHSFAFETAEASFRNPTTSSHECASGHYHANYSASHCLISPLIGMWLIAPRWPRLGIMLKPPIQREFQYLLNLRRNRFEKF
jgi:hypothetical protein